MLFSPLFLFLLPLLLFLLLLLLQVDPFTLEVPLVLSRLVSLSPPPSPSAFVASLRCTPQDVLQAMGCAVHALLLLPPIATRVPAAAAVAAAAITGDVMGGTEVELPAEVAEVAGLTGAAPIFLSIRLIDLSTPTSFGALRSNQVSMLLLLWLSPLLLLLLLFI